MVLKKFPKIYTGQKLSLILDGKRNDWLCTLGLRSDVKLDLRKITRYLICITPMNIMVNMGMSKHIFNTDLIKMKCKF